MKTSLPKQEELNKKVTWWILDANGKILGDVATKIADTIRGKNKAIYTPHLDTGDYVIVINCEKVKLTGKKMDEKIYSRHSRFPGGYKEETPKTWIDKKPSEIIRLAVYGMLPKNRLRKEFMKKLKIFAGESHPHTAQNPKKLEI